MTATAGTTNNTPVPPHTIPIRKGVIIILVGWSLLIAASLTWNMYDFQKMIVNLARIEAKANFDKDILLRQWGAKQGGVYVPISDYTPPNPYLAQIPNRDITTTTGMKLTLVNPAYMIRQVYELAAQQPGVQGHLTSLDPLRPENAPDAWEQQGLTAIAEGAKEISSLVSVNGNSYLRLIRPFITDVPCLKCHGSQGYKTGDIRGGVSVSVPMNNYYQLRWERFKLLGTWHLIIFLAGGAILLLGGYRLQTRADENFSMQQSLLKREEQLSLFRALIDQSGDSLFIVDPKTGSLLDINNRAAQTLGYEQQQLLSMSIMDIDPFLSDLTAWNTHVKEMKLREHLVLPSHHRRTDGTLVPVEISTRYLVHEQQDYIIANVRDVTERKQKEEELQQYRNRLEAMVDERTAELQTKTIDLEKSQQTMLYLIKDINKAQQELEAANQKLQELDRLKSMFIATMSHELRTPLNSVIGFSSILLEEWIGPLNPEQKINQAIILKNGKHLLSLINDIIDISKIEAGMLDFQEMDFDLDELITETTTYFHDEADSKGIAMKTAACHCRLVTDRRRLLQCMINLVSNALKFTDHGEINISANSINDGHVAISVQDTGIGISAEDLTRLFAPFQRLHSNGKYPGTGLGLYLSRKLTREVLKGELTVISVPEQGSTFTITIPTRRTES